MSNCSMYFKTRQSEEQAEAGTSDTSDACGTSKTSNSTSKSTDGSRNKASGPKVKRREIKLTSVLQLRQTVKDNASESEYFLFYDT